MRKTLWVFGLFIMLPLMVSSSAWAEFTSGDYSCNVKLNLKFKDPGISSKGEPIIHTDNEIIEGNVQLSTTIGSETLFPDLTTPRFNGCYMILGSYVGAPIYFEACINFAAFVYTDTDITKGGKKHPEKASFFGTGLAYTDDVDFNIVDSNGPISILCDNVTFQEDVSDNVTEIRTGACKIIGGFPTIVGAMTGELGSGSTFTGIFNCKMGPVM